MNRFGSLVLGIITCAVLGLAAWYFISWIFGAIFGLDRALASTVITALVAVFSVIFVYWKEQDKARKEAHRSNKIEVYSIFFDIVFEVLKKSKDKDGVDDYINSSELLDKFTELHRGALFYGSPSVIKALSDWRRNVDNTSDPMNVMRKIGTVLLAMRKDIGLSNRGLDSLTVHQIYVNDDIQEIGKVKVSV